ncbi:biotin--[acetyl-CoA-carboxylase] ligase [Halosquirtibacter laminarini]|uniref:Biotin--[acetyl-CoA-carboxylase] ligase n=1 Tax=Halosquirtibacter laminarini TaxID=3374600 RepID=A0AC61NDG8_9BACT|nr:biotin--[acetyl-CoA-carboxylase] ligase [Prolixibacteraceae bacterium]
MQRAIGHTKIQFDHIDSTNNYANELFKTKSQLHGTVVVTDYQNSGKGQKGNHWESEKGKNLTFTLLLEPKDLKIGNQFYISQAISLAIVSYLRQKGVDKVQIKWPNDIYVSHKKICGILIETQWLATEIKQAIAGVGLNVNQREFISDAPNPISITQITSIDYNLQEEFTLLLDELETYWQVMENHPEKLDTAYHQDLYLKGQWTKFKDQNGIFEGKIIGVNEYGQLIIEDRTLQQRVYNFKEVSLASMNS